LCLTFFFDAFWLRLVGAVAVAVTSTASGVQYHRSNMIRVPRRQQPPLSHSAKKHQLSTSCKLPILPATEVSTAEKLTKYQKLLPGFPFAAKTSSNWSKSSSSKDGSSTIKKSTNQETAESLKEVCRRVNMLLMIKLSYIICFSVYLKCSFSKAS
jgi:hypothetical protein